MKIMKTKVIIIICSFIFLLSNNSYASEVNYLELINPNDIQIVKTPKTIEDFEKVLFFMSVSGKHEMHIPYEKTVEDSETLSENLIQAFHNITDKHPEHFDFINELSWNNFVKKDTYFLTISINSEDYTPIEIQEKKEMFFNETKKTVDNLIRNEAITDTMSDYEKAKVIYEWMAINNSYDLEYRKESYAGYGLIFNRTAVCVGYTATFNLMLKMIGIEDVVGISGYSEETEIGHIWTRAKLDGELFYFDSTWSDPTPDVDGYCDFDFFAIDKESLMEAHKSENIIWDENY